MIQIQLPNGDTLRPDEIDYIRAFPSGCAVLYVKQGFNDIGVIERIAIAEPEWTLLAQQLNQLRRLAIESPK